MANSGWGANVMDVVRQIAKNIEQEHGEVIGIAVFARFGDEDDPSAKLDTFLASREYPHDTDLWHNLANALKNSVVIMGDSDDVDEKPTVIN